MLKNGWEFLKENVATIITIVTAIFTVVYATLRLCIYVYWKGYFTRLNIDVSIMNPNFDNSIWTVIFVCIVLFVALFFMTWVYEIINDTRKKAKKRCEKGLKKIFNKIRDLGKEILLSFIILSIINFPLTILLVSVSGISSTINSVSVLFLLMYVMEMLFIFIQLMMTKQDELREKSKENAIALIVIEVLASVLIILAMIFYAGNTAIDKKTNVQLVENGMYMISYCDGEHYLLHKVNYSEEKITICRNEQKIVGIEDCEYSIKKVKEVNVED